MTIDCTGRSGFSLRLLFWKTRFCRCLHLRFKPRGVMSKASEYMYIWVFFHL